MPQQTVLSMVQNILSSMDSDEVNSIGDTVESRQVAQIIENKYYDIVSREGLPEQRVLFQLNPSLDPTKPVLMYVPDNVVSVEWVKYFDSNVLDGSGSGGVFSHDLNVDIVSTSGDSDLAAPGYFYVTMLPIEQFLEQINRFNPLDDNVGTYTFTEGGRNFTFYYKTDHQPSFCTVIENTYVIFDSYDSTQDDTLQGSKTMCIGYKVSIFEQRDDFIPDMDDHQFPLLLNEAKALAYVELRQMPNPKAEQELRRQWVNVQKKKAKSEQPTSFDQLANFGRVPRTGGFAGGGYGAYKWMRQAGP